MFGNSQNQKAGDQSFQLSIGTNVSKTKIIKVEQDPAVTAELINLCKKLTFDNLNHFTDIAKEIINERINHFRDDYLIPKLETLENTINALKDPKFQSLLSQAQKAAALNDNDDGTCEEILTELLASKVNTISTKDKTKNIGLKKAIEAIEYLDITDISALSFLSARWLFRNINIPLSNDYLRVYAEQINANLEKFADYLPSDHHWIKNLNLLNLIEIHPLSKLKKFDNIIVDCFPKLFSAGIKTNSADYLQAIDALKNTNHLLYFLTENQFIDNYTIFPILNEDHIDRISITFTPHDSGVCVIKSLSEKDKQALHKVINLYTNNHTDNEIVKRKVFDYLYKFKNIKHVKEWFDSINIEEGLELTSAGSAIVEANLNRLFI